MSWPLPRIDVVLASLAGNRYFAVLDLTAGYHQMPLDEESALLTAFITSFGMFCADRVPFGIQVAPAYFQKAMVQEVLVGLVYQTCNVYIDDVIVFAKSPEELVSRLREVFERFRLKNIKIKPKKCQLGLSEVEYVGHVVSASGISMTKERKASIADMPQPENVTQLRSFLGLANYFRNHIQRYSDLSHTLTAMCAGNRPKKQKLVWSATTSTAFRDLKQAVLDAPRLNFLQEEGQIILYTDASDYACGGHLIQEIEGVEHTLTFVSTTLSATQRRWATIDKEMYAVFFCVKKLHYYLGARPFTLRTDHYNLRFGSTPSASPKVERWRVFYCSDNPGSTSQRLESN
jgi:hypothetical protein